MSNAFENFILTTFYLQLAGSSNKTSSPLKKRSASFENNGIKKSKFSSEGLGASQHSTGSSRHVSTNSNLSVKSLNDLLKQKDLFHLVMMHMKFKDVLNLTETSSTLNKLIEQSMFFPLNTRFTIKSFNKTKQNRSQLHSVMEKSKRRYENFHIRAHTVGQEELYLLFKQDWRDLILDISTFKSPVEYIKYVSMFTPTVSKWKMLNAKIESDNDQILPLPVPKIKNLTFINCSSAIILPFVMIPSQTLISLKVEKGLDNLGNKWTYIWKALGHCMRLTTLDIDAVTSSQLFATKIGNEANFQLTKIRIEAPNDEHICENIESFLTTQGHSLNELYLDSWLNARTLPRIWSKMTALRKLGVINRFNQTQFEPSSNASLSKLLKLNLLLFEVPKSSISKNYLQFLLSGIKKPIREIWIHAIVNDDVVSLLKEAANLVTLNGKVVWEQCKSQDLSSESSEESSSSESSESLPGEVVQIDLDSDGDLPKSSYNYPSTSNKTAF